MRFFNVVWKALLAIGILLSLVAFILGWISFGVPDWQAFRLYNNSIEEFYGLWAYCQDQGAAYGTVCERWPTAETQLFNGSRPSFISTTEGLITTGMILLSLGLVTAIIAAVLPYLAYMAALIALLAFIFLVIGLPIFGQQSNALAVARGDYQYNKRYGFWLMVPTIVLEFLASLFFLGTGLAYHYLGYGNFATDSRKKVYGGQHMLGPPHMIVAPPPPYAQSYQTSTNRLFPNDGLLPAPYPQLSPPLLSQYLTQRLAQNYDSHPLPVVGPTVLPQPSIVPAMTTSSSVISALPPAAPPSYLRVGEPVGPRFTPIVNLTGETLVGPLIRTM